ncbi:TonB-dependent receptor plug domain-containing protein [Flavobacterium wongokense]|uniref:TonB-dependent receptor plug domain-containing protein n=1 Tax=Flavobacterium wongokense TaxID=2910674 RepID=UPI00351CC207
MKYIIIALLLAAGQSFAQTIIFKKNVPEQLKKDSVAANSSTENRIIFRDNSVKEPLYILDGKPISYTDMKNLNPETIESFTILKDAGATAIYGSNGINGVIIIKTKKLSKKELRKMKKKNHS